MICYMEDPNSEVAYLVQYNLNDQQEIHYITNKQNSAILNTLEKYHQEGDKNTHIGEKLTDLD